MEAVIELSPQGRIELTRRQGVVRAWEEEDIRQMKQYVQRPWGRSKQEAFKELKESHCVWSTENVVGSYVREAGCSWIHARPFGIC